MHLCWPRDTTSAEGESVGKSWKFAHAVEAFCTPRCDAALAARDAKARKSEAVVAAVSEAASRIENAISWSDAEQINEYEDNDDDTMRKMLTGTLVTVMTSWMKQHTQLVLRQMTQNNLNMLMVMWKTLMRLHLKCMHQQVAVFKKHVSFCLVLKSASGYFLVVGIGAF